MLFSRELITLLALASATVITAVPIHSEEVTPSPELGEIFEYGAEYKREEAVAPTPELGEIFEYGTEYKREEAVAPTPELGEIFEYGAEYKRESSK